MKRSILVTVLLPLSMLAASAKAAGTDESSGSFVVNCEQAQPSRHFPDPADACWAAYDVAVKRHEYDRARRLAKVGCEKYRRADYCSFVAHLNAQNTQLKITRIAGGNMNVAESFRSALRFVTAPDVEDAEWGIYLHRRFVTSN